VLSEIDLNLHRADNGKARYRNEKMALFWSHRNGSPLQLDIERGVLQSRWETHPKDNNG
jgi:hypothetical protein